MSDKNPKGTKATAATPDPSEPSKPATMSIAPAMDLSFDAVTVPPPPPTSSGALSIPRAPRVPTDGKPAAAVKKKRGEDDIFSIFDVESNIASDDIPVSVQPGDLKPVPSPEKPKSKLGASSEEREVTRSRQIPIDQDLFNLSVGLFSNSQQAPLVAPDMSALVSPGLSDNAPAKDASKSIFDDFVLPAAPTAPAAAPEKVERVALTSVAPPPIEKTTTPRSHRSILFAGIAAAVLIAGGVFFFMQRSETTEPTAAAQLPTTSTENALDTRPGQTAPANEAPTRTAVADKPKDEPVADVKTATAPATTTGAPNVALDKPAAGGTSDKPVGQGKPAEPEATAKPEEPAAPTSTAKTQSLAEAMAAAAPGGTPPPPPPPAGGNEFNKNAATAALNGAAGAASGCKAPGDPSGVARVSITFAPSGRATRAVVSGPPFAGTTTGSCVAAAFRSVSVPAFSGDAVTVTKSVSIR